MTQYSRIPAIIVLLITTFIGVAYSFTAHRLMRSKANDQESIEAIEKALATGKVDPKKCLKYGEQLYAGEHYVSAAVAYRKYLREVEMYNHDARFYLGLSLAQAGNQAGSATAGRKRLADEFYDYVLGDLMSNPKMAHDLLSRAECKSYLDDARFEQLKRDALDRSMD